MVLAVAGLAEGTSLTRVLIQYRSEARRNQTEILNQVRASPDMTVRTALFEDSTAMVGLVLAALGLTLRQVTGSPVWDGAASIAIGVLLIVVAIRLGMDSRDYLIGRAAAPRELETIRAEIEQTPGVDGLLDLRTMYLGPERLIVAPRSPSATRSAPTGPRTSPTRSTSGSPSACLSYRTCSWIRPKHHQRPGRNARRR